MYTRNIRGDDKEYYIYTRKEAEEKGIEWVHWKDAWPGDWAITDDGYVMECRKRYVPKSGCHDVVLSGCRMFAGEDAVLEFEPHLEYGSFYMTKPQHPMEREARTTRTRDAIARVSALLIHGTPREEIPWYEIGMQMRPDYKDKEKAFVINSTKKLFRSKQIMDKVHEKITEYFDENGLSDSDIVKSIKQAMELCLNNPDGTPRENPDITNYRHLLKQASEMKGIDKPRENKVTDEVTYDFSRQIAGDMEREQHQIQAKRTKMLEEGDHEDDYEIED